MNKEQYRLLWNTISNSKKIKGLPVGCQLVYTWLIPWCDDDGRLKAEVFQLKANVFQYTDLSEKQIAEYLALLHQVNLIFWYQVDDERYIEIVKWKCHQRIRKDRYKASTYPAYKPDDNQMTTTCQPDVNPLPSPTPSPTPTNTSKLHLDWFEEFYQNYPRREAKLPAQKAYLRLKPTMELKALVMEGLNRYKQKLRREGTERKHTALPATWLNQRRWEDDYGKQPGGLKDVIAKAHARRVDGLD